MLTYLLTYAGVQEEPAAGAAVDQGGPPFQPPQGPGPGAGVPEGATPRVQDTGPGEKVGSQEVRFFDTIDFF